MIDSISMYSWGDQVILYVYHQIVLISKPTASSIQVSLDVLQKSWQVVTLMVLTNKNTIVLKAPMTVDGDAEETQMYKVKRCV